MSLLTVSYVNQPLVTRLHHLAHDPSVPENHRKALKRLRIPVTLSSLSAVAAKTGRDAVILYADGMPTRDYASFFRRLQSTSEREFVERFGVSQSTWNGYASGTSFPHPHRLEEMAVRMNFDYAFLVPREQPPQIEQQSQQHQPPRDLSDLLYVFNKVFS
ncbi:MAG TPA: helix-turn-helix transcriptional regulator [Candidatus Nanoarchaeia archaeon]|nr:helix-turn-helix transcriptional regulator [Candidatus Nanoarchaeia archaeon]